MPRRSKFAAGLFLLTSCLACAPTEATVVTEPAATEEQAKGAKEGISIAAQSFTSVVLAGEFSKLKKMLHSNDFTFNRSGELFENIRCFISWTSGCEIESSGVLDILRGEHFIYYYHLDDDNIIVSFIRENSRNSFYENPDEFLRQNYLSDYFSCHFVRSGSAWLLKESLCYSETEGPFEQEPDV